MRMPELSAYGFIRQVLLTDKVSGVVVSILILLAIVELFHQLGGSIAQMQRYRQVAGFAHIGQGFVYGQIGGVALEACSEIYGGLGKDNAAFRPTYLL